MKKLLITILFFLFLSEAHSTHSWGGSVTWECVTSGSDKGKFVFTVTKYGCYLPDIGHSGTIMNGLYAKWGGPSTITTQKSFLETLDTTCLSLVNNLACTSIAGVAIIYRWNYTSYPVRLVGVPDSNGTHFWTSSCCRPGNLFSDNTFGGGGTYLRAIMYPYLNPTTNSYDTLGTSTTSSCYDDAPVFAEPPFYLRCNNTQNLLSYGSADENGDSLVYQWADPMRNVTQSVSWRTGFSTFNQFPDTSFSRSNITAQLNSNNGFVTFKTDTPHARLATAIKVSSYRNGQKIAETFRDCVVRLIPCSNNLPVTTPTISYKLPLSSTFQPNISLLRQVGDSIELDIRVIDRGILSINPVVLQSPDLQVFGTSVSVIPNNSSKCNSPPCAYLDSVGNASWNGKKFRKLTDVTVRFKWVPSCDNLKNANGQRTFTFYVKSQDDVCLLPGQGYSTFEITLIDTISADTKLKQLNTMDSTFFLQWNAASSSSFQSYNIYGSAYASGPWTIVNSTTNINSTDYTNIPSGGIKTPIYYKIFSNTGMICLNENTVYRPVIMKKTVNKSRVYLNWNIPFVDSLNFRYGKYYIQRKDSNGAWYNLDTVNNMTHSYVDNSAGHGYTSYFRIKADNGEGFTAISNIDSVYFPLLKPIPNYPVGSGSIDTSHVGIILHDQDSWRIYPNPFNQYVLIEANAVQGSTELKVYDVKGNRVFSRNIVTGKNVVDTKTLPKGLYYFTYRNAEGEMHSERVVKVD